MRYVLLVLMIFTCCQSHLSAQTEVVFSEGQDAINVLTNTYYFEDSANALSIEEMSKKKFALHSKNGLHCERFSTSAYWVKFIINNNTKSQDDFTVEFPNSTIDELVFFYENKLGGYDSVATGDASSYKSRDLVSRVFAFNMKIEPGETKEAYFKIVPHQDAINISKISVWTKKKYAYYQAKHEQLLGLFYGVLFLGIVFYSFWSMQMRDIASLVFVLYALSLGIYFGFHDGYIPQYFTPNWSWFNNRSSGATIYLPAIFLLMFTKFYFALTVQILSIHRRILNALIVVNTLLFISCYVVDHTLFVFIMNTPISAVLSVLGVVIVTLINYNNEKVLSRYFLMAFAALFIGIILAIMRTSGFFLSSDLVAHSLRFGFTGQVVVFALAMIARFRLLDEVNKQQSLDYLRKLNKTIEVHNQELEAKVSQRTGELNEMNEELRQQYEEMEVQAEFLEKSNAEISSKNDNIINSINYAKRIQNSILPTKDKLDALLLDYFVFYQPKDIVSGDFYWVHKNNDKLYVAVVDCTGHGVPGGFMSVLGQSALKDIMSRTSENVRPSKILTLLREAIRDFLNQGDGEGIYDKNVDGMDVGLLMIDYSSSKAYFSGAKRPLYMSYKEKLEVLKGNRLSIGGHELEYDATKVFTDQEIDIEKGMMFYLTSDGFVDQFGGGNNEKYRVSRLKTTLSRISLYSMAEQEKIISNEFSSWKGVEKQIDDVLVLGVKI